MFEFAPDSVAQTLKPEKPASNVLDSLVYFSLFRHPLRVDELQGLHHLSEQELSLILKNFISEGKVFCKDSYYSVDPQVGQWLQWRQDGEARAEAFLKRIPSMSKKIASFPFVRAVAISGSLSKGVLHPKGDIDFFIITESGRLWTCRSFLMIYKKLILFNSRKHFCLNYFIDTDNLEIRDKNIFTAVEMFYLKPVFSHRNTMSDFRNMNLWVNRFFPSYQPSSEQALPEAKVSRSLPEKLLKGTFGDRLEKWFHQLTLKRWEKKFGHFKKEKFELTMRSTEGISKHHPRDFQSRVLLQFEDKLKEVLAR